jgi:hypothetical protein
MNYQELWEDLRIDIKRRMSTVTSTSPLLVSLVDIADVMNMLEAIQQDQVEMCNKCQNHVGWTRGGWCYMFQEMQAGCQKFFEKVYPPYRNSPVMPPNKANEGDSEGRRENSAANV